MTGLTELSWIAAARKHIGVREVPGPKNSTVIAGWLAKLKAWWSDDATPWCGTIAAMCVADAGLTPPKEWYRATAWLAFQDGRIAELLFRAADGNHKAACQQLLSFALRSRSGP